MKTDASVVLAASLDSLKEKNPDIFSESVYKLSSVLSEKIKNFYGVKRKLFESHKKEFMRFNITGSHSRFSVCYSQMFFDPKKRAKDSDVPASDAKYGL